MRAAVLHQFKEPLVIEEVPCPEPSADEVLIQVEACGVCHSDLHVADGDWKQFAGITKRPLILGHEVVGRVVEKGSAAGNSEIGGRVGVPWIHWTCGSCEPCREGNENLCPKQKITGVTVDGGFAEFLKAPASHIVKIPASLSPVEAAPLLCAGLTAYRALKQSALLPGERLAVFGIGGLGHLAVQIGAGMGAEVIAIDIAEQKLALATSLGAASAIHAASGDVARELRKRGGVHVALVTSAAKVAYDTAFRCLRPRGMLLVVGLPAENLCFPPIMMAAGEVCIRASAVGTRQDLRQVLALAEAGKLHCQIAARPWPEANDALQQLRQGRITGRAVLTMLPLPA
ncbi:MAG: zinc-dependent alcohol dehydrogenase [Terriglobales bacterium]